MKATDHSAESSQTAVRNAIGYFGEQYRDVFKSITADDGSVFAMLSELRTLRIPIYLHIRTHPVRKGTKNAITGCSPKGRSINNYSADDILIFSDIINNLPRMIPEYYTPDKVFNTELDRIYDR